MLVEVDLLFRNNNICRLHWTLFQFIVQSIFGLEELASIPVGFQS